MLIHGRLILTQNGIMLDETRSLLQKALRRKERDLITMATKELLGYGKDQLPWRSILTFLFEDQCLSDHHVLKKMYSLQKQDDKYRSIELLYQCYTCRIAACLPVVALETEYDPRQWESDLEVDPSLAGLVSKQRGAINFDLLLANLKKAWLRNDNTEMLSYIKLASIAHDHEDRTVTKKGEVYLIESLPPRRKPNIGLVVLSLLFKITKEHSMKNYLLYAFKLATIPEAPIRLMLFCAYTQAVYGTKAKQLNKDIQLGQIDWKNVHKLDQMPDWAVDKHTFRGKFGKGTKHLVKKRPVKMSEEHYDLFHGDRPKTGVEHFFDEGCICAKVAVEENPFWEKTKEIYYSRPHKLQKTVRMTAIYYKDILKKYPLLVYRSDLKLNRQTSISGVEIEDSASVYRKLLKRTNSDEEGASSHKRIKLSKDHDTFVKETKASRNSLNRSNTVTNADLASKGQLKNPAKGKEKMLRETPADDCFKEKIVDTASMVLSNNVVEQSPVGPLLQLPTGSGKVYTKLDLATKAVWKGPYTSGKLNIVLFFHKTMKDILGDPHTFNVEVVGRYVKFPLFKAKDSKISIFKKSFYDAIAKKKVDNGEFVSRDSLGVVQLHNLAVSQVAKVPVTMWAHFVYRFCLNVGDSGLYNAITDTQLRFFFGIDMEERRARVAGKDIINYLFPKLPKKVICDQVLKSIRQNKVELCTILKALDERKISDIRKLNEELNFDLNIGLFEERLNSFQNALSKL